MMNLSGDSKTNIDKILEEFRNAKMVEIVIHCHDDHHHRNIHPNHHHNHNNHEVYRRLARHSPRAEANIAKACNTMQLRNGVIRYHKIPYHT